MGSTSACVCTCVHTYMNAHTQQEARENDLLLRLKDPKFEPSNLDYNSPKKGWGVFHSEGSGFNTGNNRNPKDVLSWSIFCCYDNLSTSATLGPGMSPKGSWAKDLDTTRTMKTKTGPDGGVFRSLRACPGRKRGPCCLPHYLFCPWS